MTLVIYLFDIIDYFFNLWLDSITGEELMISLLTLFLTLTYQVN